MNYQEQEKYVAWLMAEQERRLNKLGTFEQYVASLGRPVEALDAWRYADVYAAILGESLTRKMDSAEFKASNRLEAFYDRMYGRYIFVAIVSALVGSLVTFAVQGVL